MPPLGIRARDPKILYPMIGGTLARSPEDRSESVDQRLDRAVEAEVVNCDAGIIECDLKTHGCAAIADDCGMDERIHRHDRLSRPPSWLRLEESKGADRRRRRDGVNDLNAGRCTLDHAHPHRLGMAVQRLDDGFREVVGIEGVPAA